jgi:hypothetical protein
MATFLLRGPQKDKLNDSVDLPKSRLLKLTHLSLDYCDQCDPRSYSRGLCGHFSFNF